MHLTILSCLCISLVSLVQAAPTTELAASVLINSISPRDVSNEPPLPYPSGFNDATCFATENLLTYNAFQIVDNPGKRSPSSSSPSPSEISPRDVSGICAQVGYIAFHNFRGRRANTQTFTLQPGIIYVFTVTSTVLITYARIWTVQANGIWRSIGPRFNSQHALTVSLVMAPLNVATEVHVQVKFGLLGASGELAIFELPATGAGQILPPP